MSDRYLTVIEGDEFTNFSAYSPDLPGVAATGATREEWEAHMREAIAFHIEGLRDRGDTVPAPARTGAREPWAC